MSRLHQNFFMHAPFASRNSPDDVLGSSSRRGAGDLAVARRLMETIRHGGDLREFKVERLRSAIGCDAYENDLKLSVAVDRLLEKLQTAFWLEEPQP